MGTRMKCKEDLDNVVGQIAVKFGFNNRQVRSAVELLNMDNTVPFIARYRKEATGGLDEVALRAIEDALESAKLLSARKTTVLKSMEEQGFLTSELRAQIESCQEIRLLEAIYLPFKPKRRTRAMTARERGLQPLADLLSRQESLERSKRETLQSFVNVDADVPDRDSALQGALDILAEQWSEDAESRSWMVETAFASGRVTSKVKRGKKDAADKFELYLDHQESVGRVPSHRILAMLRGESEGVLRVGVSLDQSRALGYLTSKLIKNPNFEFRAELDSTIAECFDRLLMPATQSAVLQTLKENADEDAIGVFGKNLRELLMSAPAGPRVTIGIDPGFRTGCKLAVVDGTGKFLSNATIYPTPPKSEIDSSEVTLLRLIEKYGVELIAIGNGTASRETDTFVGELIRKKKLPVTKVIVSESGASIYSASEIAGKEFPDLDITVRGAISIARRLQDPLAELVKTDPKSIGVGQYQHDVNQTQLRKCLDRVVESCVNHVGVDVNTASAPLLSRVAGIGPKLAENIIEYRNKHGRFDNRDQLKEVRKLGKKAFEQAAGFMRIHGGDVALDQSGVHPECYGVVGRMAAVLGVNATNLVGNQVLSEKVHAMDFVDERFGVPTIEDIISELGKPGRDPRSEFREVRFDDSVNCVEDLKTDMILEGVITNVTHFGAFIDIGVHQDALIHISQLADEFVKDPSEVVAIGDVVKVKVLEIDIQRKRLSVSRKF